MDVGTTAGQPEAVLPGQGSHAILGTRGSLGPCRGASPCVGGGSWALLGTAEGRAQGRAVGVKGTRAQWESRRLGAAGTAGTGSRAGHSVGYRTSWTVPMCYSPGDVGTESSGQWLGWWPQAGRCRCAVPPAPAPQGGEGQLAMVSPGQSLAGHGGSSARHEASLPAPQQLPPTCAG